MLCTRGAVSYFVLAQADESIDLTYNGRFISLDCPGRKIHVPSVERFFRLQNVMFNNRFFPTDAAGLTRSFGENVTSMTLTGDPAGAPILVSRDRLYIVCMGGFTRGGTCVCAQSL